MFALLSKAKIKAIYNVTIPHWEASLKRCLERMKDN